MENEVDEIEEGEDARSTPIEVAEEVLETLSQLGTEEQLKTLGIVCILLGFNSAVRGLLQESEGEEEGEQGEE